MAFNSDITRRGRARGGFAPGRGRGGPRIRSSAYDDYKPKIMSRPLGELLASLEHSDLEDARRNASGYAAISNRRYITSYNWHNGRVPTIIVPGLFS